MSATFFPFKGIVSSYFRSLLWLAVMVTFSIFFFLVTEVTIVDFLNINPHRARGHAASLPLFFAPIFLVLSALGVIIVFSLAQLAQAILIGSLSNWQFRTHGYFFIALTTPLMAILSWYCYDYLTPSDLNFGIDESSDWSPYHHGLTIQRFLVMLGLQFFVAIFSMVLLRFESVGHNIAKKRFLFFAIVFASIVGVVAGSLKAQPEAAPLLPSTVVSAD